MISRFRHLSYANVMATLAVVTALAGSAYAAATVNSRDVVDNSLKSVDLKNGRGVKGADVRNDTLTGADIVEGTLKARDGCPGAMIRLGGIVCIDPASRGDMSWTDAMELCAGNALRLPTPSELYLARHNGVFAGFTVGDRVWSETPFDGDPGDIFTIADHAWFMSASGSFGHDVTSQPNQTFCATPLSDRY